MELHEAKHIHSKLVSKRNALFAENKLEIEGYGGENAGRIKAELKSLDTQIGRYAQAFNPRIAAKAMAFLQS